MPSSVSLGSLAVKVTWADDMTRLIIRSKNSVDKQESHYTISVLARFSFCEFQHKRVIHFRVKNKFKDKESYPEFIANYAAIEKARKELNLYYLDKSLVKHDTYPSGNFSLNSFIVRSSLSLPSKTPEGHEIRWSAWLLASDGEKLNMEGVSDEDILNLDQVKEELIVTKHKKYPYSTWPARIEAYIDHGLDQNRVRVSKLFKLKIALPEDE